MKGTESTMLEVRDFFGFLTQQLGPEVERPDPENVRFWFHSSRGEFIDLALRDDHTAIESCPSSFGLKPDRVVLEFSPVPSSPSMFFFAGAFRVLETSRPHHTYPNCDLVHYEQLMDYAQFKFRLFIDFEKKPNFNHYLRKSSILDTPGCHIRLGSSLLAPPPADPLDIVDQSWDRLRLIATNPSMAAWRTVLSMYNGVYIIRDDSDGSLYVGGTFSSILSCWQADYVEGLCRGKKLLEMRSPDHVKRHFRWSLLRVFPADTPKEVIYDAEARVKRILGSRAEYLGMNAN